MVASKGRTVDAQTNLKIGNLLGAARAEVDSHMLERAFLDTSDFQALKTTDHFSFIVGRRGTGKTALFLQLIKEFRGNKQIFSHLLKPEEHDALTLLSVLRKFGLNAYNAIRPTARVLWRTAMLISVAEDLRRHWKYGSSAEAHWLRGYIDEKRGLLAHNELQRCTELLNQASVSGSSTEEIPGKVAAAHDLNLLEKEIRQGLDTLEANAVFLFDGLDEGWVPDERSPAVLGGLAAAVAGFGDRNIPIQGKLFIRDNIFRLLAASDDDFSRHIEGSTLRLNWTQDSLLNLVASRLRVVLELNTENNIRIWNRFAHRELKDRKGFQRCLQHTLYRPRDILVLLNQAAVRASREGREGIIDADIEETSKQISLDRLTDLLKEYEGVFPGLGLIVWAFSGVQAFQTTGSVKSQLDNLIEQETYRSPEASDIAVLGTSSQIVDALFSVGFLGLEDAATGTFLFCHDGASSSISETTDNRRIVIHPCYWKALDITDTDIPTEILVEIHDDYKSQVNPEISNIRTRRLGQLVTELPNCPEGQDGANEYEKWVLTACQILFAGDLANFALHPTPDGIQRRDVIATNQAERGFWKRVLDDYKCRQVVFEAKNFADLSLDDFRQALSYTGNQYGNLVFIVNRVDNEKMDDKVRAWVKEMWDQKRTMVMTLPTAMLTRCLKKVRSPNRRNYVDEVLSRRLDTFERSYLSLRHARGHRQQRKTKK